jgi:xylose isomerase
VLDREAPDGEDVPDEPKQVARAIRERPDTEYDQVIARYLRTTAEDLRGGNVREAQKVRRQVTTLIEELDEETLERLVSAGGDLGDRREFLLDAGHALSVDAVVKVLKEEQKRTGIRLLWGTACLFIHPRFVHGAATSCNADVFAYAAAQVKKAIEATHELGGAGYTFWGGREGYTTLLNTNMKRELDHLARFLHMAVEHKKKIGFKGQFYIEPKPKEPTKHQYDSDVAACLNFLREYNLMPHFKLNVESNHATLAGHTFHHELEMAAAANALGSIDANVGDLLLGWDTDQFPTDVYGTTLAMHSILNMGGFKTGGVNFDAKLRRESFEPDDLFYGHIAGMDTFARGLKAAAAIRADGRLEEFVKKRYSSWDEGIGKKIESGKMNFAELESYMLKKGNPARNDSGRQEYLEALLNEFI